MIVQSTCVPGTWLGQLLLLPCGELKCDPAENTLEMRQAAGK